MDKFVVRLSKQQYEQQQKKSTKSKCLKQSTIGELKGVVSIDRLLLAKRVLSTPDTSADDCLEHLRYLHSKKPAVEILQSTKIGRVVKKLNEHENAEIRSLSAAIVRDWTDHVQRLRSRKHIQVEIDGESRARRRRAKNTIRELILTSRPSASTSAACTASNKSASDLYETPETDAVDELAQFIETYIFTDLCKRRTTAQYQKLLRRLALKLKYNPAHCEKLKNLNPTENADVVRSTVDEILSRDKVLEVS